MQVRPIAGPDMPAVEALCGQELVLDRAARTLPGILARGPHIALVATHGARPAGVCFGSADASGGGFIDLIVVAGGERRRGVGRSLMTGMETRLAAAGCDIVTIAGHGPHYAWPGIDIHYTAAVCLAEDLGYRRTGCEVNMDVDIRHAPLGTQPAEDRLRAQGIVVRPATLADDGPMQESLVPTWRPDWIAELTAALRTPGAGLHVAVQDQRYLGFCAYGIRRLHEVGPVGTAPESRGLGIGGVLLRRCLADLRDRGLDGAELVWAGPLSYFSRTLGATIGRAFWQYEKDLRITEPVPDWRDRIGLI